MKIFRPFRPRRLSSLLVALGLGLLVACSGSSSGSGSSFIIRSTTNSVDPSAPMMVDGNYLVYLASEALTGTATDLNGDTDTLDEVAVVVRLGQRTEQVLGVAVTNCAVLENEIYLVVDEAEDDPLDTKDWDGDVGTDNVVLLHWSFTADVVTFVDTIALDVSNVPVVTAGNRLYYASTDPTAGGDTTNLRYIDPADPLTPVAVENQIGGGELEPSLLGVDDDLVFLLLNETDLVVDFNGDGDTGDGAVLALLDGTQPEDRILNVGLALADANAPFAARSYGNHEWLVGFLVNEDQQGGVSLNPDTLAGQPIVPDACLGAPDTDADDDVLHFLDYGDFLAGTSGPENTALVGRDRVLIVDDYVATLSPESDAFCNLNGDADTTDIVLRWTEATVPVMPSRDDAQLRAVQDNIPGGSFGASTLNDRFVAVISEAKDSEDQDGKAPNHDLVAWLRPSTSFTTPWTFAHQSGSPSIGTGVPGEPYAGASWLAPMEENGRLGVTYQESVPPIDLNNTTETCEALDKDNDTQDEFPIWLDFEGSILDFDGVPIAVVQDNPGLVLSRGFAFFRVSESEDNVDYNADGDKGDVILMRHPLTASCSGRAMGTAHPQEGPVVITDGIRGGAFLASELAAQADFNGDGDENDTVVRYFSF